MIYHTENSKYEAPVLYDLEKLRKTVDKLVPLVPTEPESAYNRSFENNIDNIQESNDSIGSVGSLVSVARGDHKHPRDSKLVEDIADVNDALVITDLIAKGRINALVFDNHAQIDGWFAGTYTRPDDVVPADLLIGQNIYVKTVDESDYWVSVLPTTARAQLTVLANGDKPAFAGYVPFDSGNINLATGKTYKVNNVDFIDIVYPVNSIYLSVSSTSPATLFGGTWEQLKDRFLLGAGDTYTNGATGGSATHTLTVNEMPSHRHEENGALMAWVEPNGNVKNPGSGDRMKSGNALYTGYTGGGGAHNNMPPYLAVYMWKRTA